MGQVYLGNPQILRVVEGGDQAGHPLLVMATMATVRVQETRAQAPLPLNTGTIASEGQWPEPTPLQPLQD